MYNVHRNVGVHCTRQLIWGSLCFLDLHVYILRKIRDISFHYFFKYIFSFLFSSSPSGTPVIQMVELLEMSQSLLILFLFF